MKKTILIITILSGLVLSINSCTTVHHCSAYAQVNVDNSTNTVQANLPHEDI